MDEHVYYTCQNCTTQDKYDLILNTSHACKHVWTTCELKSSKILNLKSETW